MAPEPRRLELQALLQEIANGAKVYFQPPPNLQMEYPCIVYKRDRAETEFADNNPYRYSQGYQVTVIDEDPDSDIRPKIALLPTCRFVQHFTADNLNHDVYNLFF